MRIEVRLYGEVTRYAPGGRSRFHLALAPGATLKDALDELAVPEDGCTALINGRRADPGTRIEDGDTLVFIPLLSGG